MNNLDTIAKQQVFANFEDTQEVCLSVCLLVTIRNVPTLNLLVPTKNAPPLMHVHDFYKTKTKIMN